MVLSSSEYLWPLFSTISVVAILSIKCRCLLEFWTSSRFSRRLHYTRISSICRTLQHRTFKRIKERLFIQICSNDNVHYNNQMRYKGFHLVGSNKSCYHFVGSHKCEDPRSGSKTHFYIYWKKKFNKGQRYVVVELDTIGPRIKFKITLIQQ